MKLTCRCKGAQTRANASLICSQGKCRCMRIMPCQLGRKQALGIQEGGLGSKSSIRKGLLRPTRTMQRDSGIDTCNKTKESWSHQIQSEGGTIYEKNSDAPWAIPLSSHLTIEESSWGYRRLEAHREGVIPSWELRRRCTRCRT